MPRKPSKMESRIERVEGQLGEMKEDLSSVKTDIASVKGDLSAMMKLMKEQLEEMRRESKGKHTMNDDRRHESEMSGHSKGKSHSQNSGSSQSRMPRIDFPKFLGENPMQWIRQCNKYFVINPLSDVDKILTAALYMEGNADLWYLEYVEGLDGLTWEEFSCLVVERFTNLEEKNLVAQFNKLKQDSDVMSYTLKFEELKAFMVGDNREDYFVKSYLSGLKDEISNMVEMFNPRTLGQAIKLAKRQELQLLSLGRGPKQVSKVQESNWKKPQESNTPKGSTVVGVSDHKTSNFRKLTPEEIEIRRKKKLCFNCDEPYQIGHKCKKLFTIICEESQEEVELVLHAVEEAEDDFQISVNALAGQLAPDTIRLQGKVGRHSITILIDTGSTHSFLDEMAARRIGCEVEYTNPLLVTVADGGRIECNTRCPKLEWEMGACQFSSAMRLLRLGGCDMVVGVDLLRQLGPITFNFGEQNIKFTREGKDILLQGIKQEMTLKMITGKKFKRALRKGKGSLFGCLFMISAEKVIQDSKPALEIQPLISKYLPIFETPTTLPPNRNHDHKIPLKPNTIPFKQNPYRYPYLQRMEIEKLVQEMLDTGIIQPSTSSFSSPVLLVKKKDETWRFCVDYRKLNSCTIKDNFPIPLVDDLLDELGGAAVFSKVDLRAGYHQIRMCAADIHKTAFVTSSGLYEFKVMPFGLTNAPATFQSLMNTVFRPFLGKFVLVFFDDILIFSKSMAQHLLDLEKVFQVMAEQQLFAKASKCSFGTSHVEYLGHIISDKGVAADPQKIQAMVDWPKPKNLKALRGFLGLTGYYRKFVRNYGSIARPLNDITKKGNFIWREKAEEAFHALKKAMVTAPVLALPNFELPFVLETDDCYNGIGAVLMQDHHPIAFLSKSLAPKNRGLSIYEKEFLAIILATEKWRSYLLHK
ncbi:uncharacterized protein LOC130998610 [Salvia miltiorrhiza]|uniref:uncharacterized protein LOC130998610 n=1 Tax=Salvia miltiorrhiza TaxID=226208 RepID=UPI0025AC74D0|nr:uncharacterized protein LOC130998610 [Salvia miltiorrhiza]